MLDGRLRAAHFGPTIPEGDIHDREHSTQTAVTSRRHAAVGGRRGSGLYHPVNDSLVSGSCQWRQPCKQAVACQQTVESQRSVQCKRPKPIQRPQQRK